MKIKQILTESLSQILYHKTDLSVLDQIIKSNSFRLTPSIGTEAEIQAKVDDRILVGDFVNITDSNTQFLFNVTGDDKFKVTSIESNGSEVEIDFEGDPTVLPLFAVSPVPKSPTKKQRKLYYMSTARSKVSDFRYPTFRNTQSMVSIVLDGRKLMADGYSGNPIDYWEGQSTTDEMEDRVLSQEPYINNASKYIIEIHVLFVPENFSNSHLYDESKRMLRNAIKYGKTKGIDVYVYNNPKDFDLQDTRRATGVDLKISGVSLFPDNTAEPYKQKETFNKNRYNPSIAFKSYTRLLYLSSKSEFNDIDYDIYRELSHGLDVLKTMVHNNRNSRYRKDLDKFIKHLKKNNIADLKKYRNFIMGKFR